MQQDQLKGIDYAYDTYTLFAPRALNGLYVNMRTDKEHGRAAMPYGETAEWIPPHIVEDFVRELTA